jgi:4-hydroxybenzoate polyprenyltransferase
MNKILKFIFDEIFYNGHFQTWGSLAIVISSGQLLGIKITWDLLAVVYLLFYAIYLYDRYKTVEIDSLTNQARSKHIKKIYRFTPWILSVILTTMLFLLFRFSNIYAVLFVIVIVPLGFFYPIYFKKFTKKIIGFKNIYVASIFSIFTIFPSLYYGIAIEKTYFLILFALLLFTFLRGVMMQVFLDLKDIEGDKKEGLLTLAIVYGKERVYKIINIMNLITSLAFPVLYFIFPAWNLTPAILFLSILAVWNFYFFNLARRGNYFGFVLGSGEFIYWPVSIYLGQIMVGFFY